VGLSQISNLLDSVTDLVNKEFAWDGKYDPASDTIVMRQGSIANSPTTCYCMKLFTRLHRI
jgi:hypothetical protein